MFHSLSSGEENKFFPLFHNFYKNRLIFFETLQFTHFTTLKIQVKEPVFN